MDEIRFDYLARALSIAGTRRGLLSVLVTLPDLGVLVESAFAGDVEDSGARPVRHKKRRKHGEGRQRQPRCRAESRAKACAGQCGRVKNNCKKVVDCGPCLCELACPACQICDEASGTCGADPAQVGDECRSGHFCREDGLCSCEATSCAACETCQQDGACSPPCGGEGCCADDSCEPGNTIAACGSRGESCQVCAENETCWNGNCVCGDVCASGCRFTSLAGAIHAAGPGDTIRLCAETYRVILEINKNLTLLGAGDGENGTVITRQREGTIVTVPFGAKVELKGVRITGGIHSLFGGAILNGGILTLTDSTVTGNRASFGAGIYNGGALTLKNSKVKENIAYDNGGGIHNSRGTLRVLSGSTVSENVSIGGEGGGVYNELGTVTITESTAEDNWPDDCAGDPMPGCSG